MKKFEEYDKKVLDLIDNGCDSFHDIATRLREENKKFDNTDQFWRVTDRRLQALRRAGKIVFNSSRRAWSRNQVQEVPK